MGGWVHDVAWSPSGDTLGYVAHDSTIGFVDVNEAISNKESGGHQKVALSCLPYKTLIFVDENTVIGKFLISLFFGLN
mgnify:FL=1